MQQPVLVILAAGLGSRYGGLKQMDPLGPDGEIILDFSAYDAMRAGFREVVFIIKKENERDFRELIDRGIGKKLRVSYAFQSLEDLPGGYTAPAGRVKPWGTAHAVWSARAYLDRPCAVLNADDYYGPDAFVKIYHYLSLQQPADEHRLRCAMVGYVLKNTMTDNGSVARGICEASADGYLRSVVEHTRIAWENGVPCDTLETGEKLALSPDAVTSMNFWGFPAGIVQEIEREFPTFLEQVAAENPMKAEFFIPTLVDALLQQDRATVRVLTSTDRWFGVTYREDKPGVQAALRALKEQGVYPKRLWD